MRAEPRENLWRRWHRGGWLGRGALKLGLFLLVTALALYPRVWLIPTWLSRLADMNCVVEPGHPALAPLEAEVRQRVASGAPPAEMLRAVQQVVERRIPYAFDWQTWGVMDYLPTVGEVFALGREDCDGRAVVAASLLRRLGYEATLVSDLKHTWVATPAGETMSPGQGARSLAAGPSGTRAQLDAGLLANLARGLGFGVVVFPLGREALICAALVLLTLHPRSSLRRRGLGAALVFAGLFLMRGAGDAGTAPGTNLTLVWAGLGCAAAGWALLAFRAGADRSAAAPPGSPAEGGVRPC